MWCTHTNCLNRADFAAKMVKDREGGDRGRDAKKDESHQQFLHCTVGLSIGQRLQGPGDTVFKIDGREEDNGNAWLKNKLERASCFLTPMHTSSVAIIRLLTCMCMDAHFLYWAMTVPMETEISCTVKVMQIYLWSEADCLRKAWLWCACRKCMFHYVMG
eukprot:9209970-Ditylum_brightwellii.AAC.3